MKIRIMSLNAGQKFFFKGNWYRLMNFEDDYEYARCIDVETGQTYKFLSDTYVSL
jgi:hypothetical protein